MRDAIGLIEVPGFSPTLVILDVVDKAAEVRLLHVELNDMLGACIKVAGEPAAIKAALEAAENVAKQMRVDCVTQAINKPDEEAWKAIDAKKEFSPLLEADVIYFPNQNKTVASKENAVSENGPFAIGLIETQGLTAVLEAVDTACKAGNVQVLGREKLGGGYVTVIIRGDVAAVNAAVQAAKESVDGLGKLIAAHVIARPSEGVLSLLPK